MSGLLELREKIKGIYNKNEVFILPVLKFMLAYLVFCMVNGALGYMTQIDNVGIVLMAALMCSFLPNSCVILFATLFGLLHMYALSMEVALVVLCIVVVLGLLFFRFGSKESALFIFTVVAMGMKLPCIVPVAAGLLATPLAVLPVCSGVILYYLVNHISVNENIINTMVDNEGTQVIKLVLDGIIADKTVLLTVIAFAITILVVYFIRRMSIDYSWTIAMVAGVILNFIILMIGGLVLDAKVSFFGILFGSILALAIAKGIELFRFCVDYNRVEKVQFEDAEYYYYVKAVPKMAVAKPQRTTRRMVPQTGRTMENPVYEQRNTRTVTTQRSATPVRNTVPTRSTMTANGTTPTRSSAVTGATPVRSGASARSSMPVRNSVPTGGQNVMERRSSVTPNVRQDTVDDLDYEGLN